MDINHMAYWEEKSDLQFLHSKPFVTVYTAGRNEEHEDEE